MAENDDLFAEMDQSWHCLELAIKESRKGTMTLKTEDGYKIIRCIEKSRIRLDQGQPSETKKRVSMSLGEKKNIYVYLSRTQSKLIQTVEEEFSKLLWKMSLTYSSFTGKEKLRDDSSLIVLCPIFSRLESDIQNVLKELQNFSLPGRFALAVINMTREDNLPRLPIQTRLDQLKDDYKNIHFIDMAFTRENLMYDCSMNRKATEKIQDFVNNMCQK